MSVIANSMIAALASAGFLVAVMFQDWGAAGWAFAAFLGYWQLALRDHKP